MEISTESGSCTPKNPVNASKSCRSMIEESAASLAQSLGAVAVFVFGDLSLEDFGQIPVINISLHLKTVIEKLSFIKQDNQPHIKEVAGAIKKEAESNASMLQTAAAIEYALGNIDMGIVVGIVHFHESYSIVVHNMAESNTIRLLRECEKRISPETLRSVLHLSLSIATKGREGKKVGTAFIIGDEEEVMSRSHQMILNPYKSQEAVEININRKENWESVMGFSQLDGVFIVSAAGEILAAGRYLDVDTRDLNLEKGLGTRHLSSASITRDTIALAVIVSESGGTVRMYMDGKEVIFIDPFQSVMEIDGETVS
ncbi:DNA integrity scanning protein DisA nucleotide-binding domain protein [Methanolapillus millepedarum]|uniref:Diadenylate cyclase n=1 Tax=Methanolapillus millepedarum TaxID=3028296 RepID=A0AA96V4Q3_9EURY|nr:Diadenylate cyclase [Methanosarcinaceae archaeon Ac7]